MRESGQRLTPHLLQERIGHALTLKWQATSYNLQVTSDESRAANYELQELIGHAVNLKFEQRAPSGDVHDEFLSYLSGEQEGEMEISYSKQQQKQKQKAAKPRATCSS